MDNKWFLKSKTIYGAIIVMLPSLVAFLNTLGVPLTEDVLSLFEEIGEHAFAIAASILVVYGRWKADTSLTLER